MHNRVEIDKTKSRFLLYSHDNLILFLLFLILTVCILFPKLTNVWDCFFNPYYFTLTSGICILTFCAWAIYNSVSINFRLLDSLISAFFIYVAINSLLRDYTILFEESFSILIATLIVYVLARQIKTRWHMLFKAIIMLGVFAAGHGLLQYLDINKSGSSVYVITGFYNNSGPYAGLLAIITPICFYFALRPRWMGKYIFWMFFFVISVSLILTYSRAAIIASFFGCIAVVFNLKRVKNIFLYRKGFFNFIAVSVLSGIIIWLVIQIRPESVEGRLLTTSLTMRMISDNPVTGVGFGRFKAFFPDYQSNYLANNLDSSYYYLAGMSYYAFNDLLQVVATLGLPIIFFIFCIVYILFIRTKHPVEKGIFVAIGLFSLASYPFSNIAVTALLMVGLAKTAFDTKSVFVWRMKTPVTYIVFCAFIIFSLKFIYKEYQVLHALKTWQEASQLISTSPKYAFILYEELHSELLNHGDFLFNYGAELCEAGFHKKSISILRESKATFNHIDLYLYLAVNYEELGMYNEAEYMYKHAIYMIPHRFYPRYLLVQLYQRTNQVDKALLLANEIIDMPIKVHSPIVEDIRNDMRNLINYYQR